MNIGIEPRMRNQVLFDLYIIEGREKHFLCQSRKVRSNPGFV